MVTLNNNGTTATANITVVPAAFGIFTQSQTGSGAAVAFNVNPDGSTTLNSLTSAASSGQTVLLNGTGLGAITSDETQSGVTDTPSGTPQVWVGLQKATVVSASRGSCCTGLDPTFDVPEGVAGWDVIQIVVPNGITGCHVPVAVQTGNMVSNFSTIAVSNGGPCTDPNGFNAGSLQTLTSGDKVGGITLSRTAAKISAGGMTITSNTDSGGASFYQYDLTQLLASPSAFANIAAVGSCYVITTHLTPGQTPTFPNPTGLDAGAVLNVKGPNGAKQMMPSPSGGVGSYSGTFGTSSVLPPIPGLPPGTPLPGLPGQTPPYLEAGTYTVDNGSGGADVGPFTATLILKTPLTWTNMDAITQVTRSQGVQVTWSGGDPAGTVKITGGVTNMVGSDIYLGAFTCIAPVSAGQFMVPSIVTLSMPASTSSSGGPAGAVPTGSLAVGTTVSAPFTATGINSGTISSSVVSFKGLAYN
jgi:uncharacterized protein (TIGR03437 family)